jgi:hypothetical protein
MRDRRRNAKVLRVAVPLSAGALALIAGINGPLAEMSEMDGFDRAVTSGSKEDAMAFIDQFGSSHLVPDLIELLPPDVAAAVCADLPSSASSAADRACQQIKSIIATAPAAGTVAPEAIAPEEAPSNIVAPEETPPEQDLFTPPEAKAEEEPPTGVGYQRDTPGNQGGSSDGSADGSGDGSADGSGDGSADGSGDGSADGSGDGSADGSGDGSADGSGQGQGQGSPG